MCFAPQRRTLFRNLNVKKWSEPVSFLHFWLGNVLRATTACTFSTSQLLKVLRSWGALYILTWQCASRHRDFPTFSRTCIFFLLTLSLLCSSHFLASPLWLFPPLLFHLSILSEVWLLNFLRPCSNVVHNVNHVRKFRAFRGTWLRRIQSCPLSPLYAYLLNIRYIRLHTLSTCSLVQPWSRVSGEAVWVVYPFSTCQKNVVTMGLVPEDWCNQEGWPGPWKSLCESRGGMANSSGT